MNLRPNILMGHGSSQANINLRDEHRESSELICKETTHGVHHVPETPWAQGGPRSDAHDLCHFW